MEQLRGISIDEFGNVYFNELKSNGLTAEFTITIEALIDTFGKDAEFKLFEDDIRDIAKRMINRNPDKTEFIINTDSIKLYL